MAFLRNPQRIIPAGPNRTSLAGIKLRAHAKYEVQPPSGVHIYRRAEGKFPARYAACTTDALRIIGNTHSAKHHQKARKVYEFLRGKYYGISEPMVRWVLKQCSGCELVAPNKTKKIIRPIISSRCLDRIQIDLMDFRSRTEGENRWVIQIKDHFSHYVWVHPLEDKTSEGVARVMANWLMYNGRPRILQVLLPPSLVAILILIDNVIMAASLKERC